MMKSIPAKLTSASAAVSFLCCVSVVIIQYAVGNPKSDSRGGEVEGIDVEAPLTVNETIAVPIWDFVPQQWHLYRNANPKAKDGLYRIVEMNDLEHSLIKMRALIVLGYIGNGNDAHKMRDILARFSGVLSVSERNVATGIFSALGIMSRRDISEATEMLDEMTSLDYWKQSEIKWFSEEQVRQLTPELEILALVFRSQAIAERDDLDQMRKEILEGIEQPQLRQHMAYRISRERTEGYARNIREAERKSPTEEERRKLKRVLRSFSHRLEGVDGGSFLCGRRRFSSPIVRYVAFESQAFADPNS